MNEGITVFFIFFMACVLYGVAYFSEDIGRCMMKKLTEPSKKKSWGSEFYVEKDTSRI